MKELESKMQKSLEVFEKTISNIRTGRANPAMLETLKVEVYGAQTPLKSTASINNVDVRTLKLSPFDAKNLNAIEKTIMEANLGVSVRNDGHVIFVGFPELTEERRKELIKLVKTEAENTRVAIRNQRRDHLEHLKKDPDHGKDQQKSAQDQVQKLTDLFMKKIDDAVLHKEKAILTL